MPTRKSPRKGSLQYWPRKRASKFLPSVNWKAISSDSEHKLKGFICYKAGMASAFIKDNTPDSMTKGKEIVIPVTILECPPMRIFSVRLYKSNKPIKEILAENPDKELKKKIKVSKKKPSKKIDDIKKEDYDDLRILVYSQVKKTNIKKKPDLTEIGLSGSLEDKINFIKEKLDKGILVSDVFEKNELIDFRGLTKGKGFSGPVKRFGIKLKQAKSEKGRRRPGSIGPWHPARVTFRVPMAGQLGMFTRLTYNHKIIEIRKGSEHVIRNIKNYGEIKADYIIVNGSIQGPAKRQLLITKALRETRKQSKKNYELMRLA